MIDFRYHVVSIVAVFLAAAVGIVLGTTTLNGVVLKDLNGRVSSLSHDKDTLRQQLSDAQSKLARDQSFAAAAAAPLLAGRLTGHRVVVVRAPGASAGLRDRVAQAVLDAGGEVSTSLELTTNYVDSAQATRLDNLVTSLTPPGVDLPTGGTASQRAATVVASLLVAPAVAPGSGAAGSGEASTPSPGTTSSEPAAGLDEMLTGLESAGMVKVLTPQPKPGDLAVIVSGDGQAPSPGKTAAPLAGSDALLDLVGQLDARGSGAVVAGSAAAAQPDSLLTAVRGSGIADTVSTVDSADAPQGLVAVVYALAAQPRGDAGAYGQAAAGDAPLPKLVP